MSLYPVPVELEPEVLSGACAKMEHLPLVWKVFVSHVLAAHFRFGKDGHSHHCSLLNQTDTTRDWNRTDVSLLYWNSLWEQLCINDFASY